MPQVWLCWMTWIHCATEEPPQNWAMLKKTTSQGMWTTTRYLIWISAEVLRGSFIWNPALYAASILDECRKKRINDRWKIGKVCKLLQSEKCTFGNSSLPLPSRWKSFLMKALEKSPKKVPFSVERRRRYAGEGMWKGPIVELISFPSFLPKL